MPIKDLTPRLQEIGKIKIGRKSEQARPTKSGGTFRPPEKMDHFLICSPTKDAAGNFIPQADVMTRIADETGQDARNIRQIPIILLFNDVDKNFHTFRACYTGKTCFCRCDDGETARRKTDGGNYQQLPCDPYSCPYANEEDEKKPRCKFNGILSVVLPAVNLTGGVYLFRTTSANTISAIEGSIRFLFNAAFGKIAGLPLQLSIYPKTVEVKGSQKIIYTVNIEYPGNLLSLRQKTLENFKELQAIETEYRRLLPAPSVENETEEEAADVAEEFYPGTVDAAPPKTTEQVDEQDSEQDDPFFKKPAPPQKKQPTAATITQSPVSFTQSDEDESEISDQSDESEESEQPEPIEVKQIKPAAAPKKKAPAFSWN